MSDDLSSAINAAGPFTITTGGAPPSTTLSRGGKGACVPFVIAGAFNARCSPMVMTETNLVGCCSQVDGQTECGSDKCYLDSGKVDQFKRCIKGGYSCVTQTAAAPGRAAATKAAAALLAVALVLGLT